MGLYNGSLANYYGGLETLGGYQFISITDVINNFRVAYVGEDKIIPKISRADIKFHALRGLQELTYDTFRSCKTLELEIPPSLLLPLPHDYVEYVKISWIDSNGRCHTIRQCKTCPKDPLSYVQRDGTDGRFSEGDINVGTLTDSDTTSVLVTPAYGEGWKPIVTGYTGEGENRTEVYSTDVNDERNWAVWHPAVYEDVTTPAAYSQNPTVEDSTTWSNLQSGNNSTTDTDSIYLENDMHYSHAGRRYGIDPAHATVNGCFWINCKNGKIYFDSHLAGKTVTIQYISDTVATDDEMMVHKFAEEAMYRHIAWAILNTRANTDPNLVATYKKERFAAIRNAKIRLSSIKLEELTQILRGKSKWIKH